MDAKEVIARLEEALSAIGNSGDGEAPAPREEVAWLELIPSDRYVLRRIVGVRALRDASTGLHRFGWSSIAARIGADTKAVRRWHAEGIEIIVDALNSRRDA